MNRNVPNGETKQEQNKAAGLIYTALKQDHAMLHIFSGHTLEETKI